MKSNLSLLVAALIASSVDGFSSAIFHEVPTLQRTAPSKSEGVDIELPDFDELFDRIQQVSPLARSVISRGGAVTEGGPKGFAAMEDSWPENLKWKNVDKNPNKVIHQIDKIDNFDGKTAPLLRFRSSLEGPCIGEYFADFIMNFDQRKLWDPQIQDVYEIYPIHDLDAANIAMGFGKLGDCSRLGVGYCQTKGAGLITAREQLTLCGIQDFSDGSCIIWGTEMQDRHNYMFPPGKHRHTRARSHIFCTTITPTGDNTFDAEYALQLDIGGKIPAWLTAPVVTETVKSFFKTTKSYFKGKDGHLDAFIKKKAKEMDCFVSHHSLLMTP